MNRYEKQDGKCIYCGSWFKNLNALAQHEYRCKLNPDRKDFNNLGNYSHFNIKGKTKDNCEQIAKQADVLREMYKNGLIIKDYRNYSKRFHAGWYKGYWCDSSWELAFVIYNLEHNIKFERNKEKFTYILDGHICNYYPDFIIDGIYYEIKGRMLAKDYCKINQFPKDKQIRLLLFEDIKIYLDYACEKYGNKFWYLYEQSSC